jgi:hypothetical protein
MMNTENQFDIRLAYEALTDFSTARAVAPSRVREGREIRVPCPIHGDEHASMDLDIEKNRYFCRACRVGGDTVALVMAIKKLPKNRLGFTEAFTYLRQLSPEHVHATKAIVYGNKDRYATKKVVKVASRRCFTYHDRDGLPVHDVIRIEGQDAEGGLDKDFLQRRRLPEGGAWYDEGNQWVYRDGNGHPVPRSVDDTAPVAVSKTYRDGKPRRRPSGPYTFNMTGVSYQLYHLPRILEAAKSHDVIYMVEGEKKCEALRDRAGLAVTTIAGGAAAILESRWIYDLAGARQLVILADSDVGGRKAARDRAQFFRLGVFDVRVVDFFKDDSKRDVADWLALHADKTADELRAALDDPELDIEQEDPVQV